MREESQLPDELKQLEDHLRSTALSQSRLDRDTVMYQAGWAAAVASDSVASQRMNTRLRSTSPQWHWKAATASLASIATVLAIMLVQQSLLDGSKVKRIDEATVLIATDEAPRELPRELPQGELASAIAAPGREIATNTTSVEHPAIAASYQPTFFQALFGVTSPPENQSLAKQRLEKALNESDDFRVYKDGTADALDAESQSNRTYLRASSSSVFQELFPYKK